MHPRCSSPAWLLALVACSRAPDPATSPAPSPIASHGSTTASGAAAPATRWLDLADLDLQAHAGQVVTMRGYLVQRPDGFTLHEALAESMPPRPAGASAALDGVDPARVAPWMEHAAGHPGGWSRHQIVVEGRVQGQAIAVHEVVEAWPGPAWPVRPPAP